MSYDVIFIGGGPAGYEGAIAAGKKGLKVAVVEMDKPGGTCLQRGCIPSKALLNTVKYVKGLKSAAKCGVKVEGYSLDIDAIVKHKNRTVNKLTKGIESLFRNYNVDHIKGRGNRLPLRIRLPSKVRTVRRN